MHYRTALAPILAAIPNLLVAQQPTWSRGGNPAAAYTVVTATGSALDRAGATLTLRSDTAGTSMFGLISATIVADSFRGRRVRISADIDARNVSVGASAWLRVDGPSGTIALENGIATALMGTTTGRREITLNVPNEATNLMVGLFLRGAGQATANNLRIETLAVSNATPAAQRVLDSAFAIVRAHALWRDTVTWAVVEPRVRAIATGAQAESEVYPAIRALLTSLGDQHSFHMVPDRTRQFRTGGATNPRPLIRALDDSIGYISVPAYAGADTAATRVYVEDVYRALRLTVPQTSCRWVVDLRTNGGGNMWPMLAGLRPLLGDSGLGSFVSARGPGPLWRARSAYNVPLEPALARLEAAHVAVLTGPRTASSGEAVTISFVGRPRTRSFGLPTRGLSTANSTFPLPDSSMIVLTVSVEANRNGVRYGGRIDPDESIPVDSTAGDVQLSRAVAWLKSQSSCGS